MSDSDSHQSSSRYAWREVERREPGGRSVQERVADCLEVCGIYDEETAREQASRCIQCPNPTCVSGCPLCNPIPQWMQLTAEGRFLEAAAVLGSVSNMAEVCTHICPSDRLCEHDCILESISDPVSIKAIERFVMEYAFRHNAVDTSTAPPNGKKVAVIGSGPAGMACAEDLARKGYAVSIFDSSLVPGGLLVNGMPPFKIGQSLIQRRIEILKKRGVVFHLGVKLWDELTLGRFIEQFDAVFLGFDSRRARALNLPGANLPGVVQAVPFLLQKSTAVALEHPPIDVAGKQVVVIGAGDTAMDCLHAAARYGARTVTCAYRQGEEEMPCSQARYQQAIADGAKFLFHSVPVAVLGADNKVTELELQRTVAIEPGAAPGLRGIRAEPGSDFRLPADIVITALGFESVPCPRSGELEGLALGADGGIQVDELEMTSIPGVFAAGDLVTGPTLVIETVRDARRAAEGIHKWLTEKQPSAALEKQKPSD